MLEDFLKFFHIKFFILLLFASQVNESRLFLSLFHTRYISHVLRVFNTQSQ